MNKKKSEGLSRTIFSKKISSDSLSLLCSKFAVILKSGMQVAVTSELLYKQCEDKYLKEILFNVSKSVKSGENLSDAFEKNSHDAIPQTFFETIRAGENSGNLINSFKTLEEYYKRQSKIKKQIKSSLVYPVFVISVAVIVLIVVMAYVMPKLLDIFNDMGEEIPIITRVLMKMSSFFSDNIIILSGSFIAFIIFVILYISSERGRAVFDGIKLKIPVVGKIQNYSLSAQFATTLSMLLNSGLVMVRALDVLAKTFDNVIYKNAVLNLSNSVKNGKRLYISMKKEYCFSSMLIEMTSIGEETGELEEILNTIGEYYQGEAESGIKSALTKLEPILLILVAILAGFIVFAIYIPLFQMYDLF